ncbi:MAG TPA: polysaccharide deacetylase family protein [Burkholderiaceae bacterium]|nr:polysaccharide deacetylase family protein [Burkholderiaceae bacterium]
MMKRSVPFLMYHAIADDIVDAESGYTTTPAAFEAQMRHLRETGWTTMTVGAVVDAWDRGRAIPERTAVVTFDDGFECLHRTALPILREYGIAATAFLISGYLDGMASYDADLGIRARRMLTREQVRELAAAGLEIGSHTVSHRDLRALGPAELRDELERSRAELEALTGRPVRTFSFPRGLLDRAVHDAVARAGYRAACSTEPGLNDPGTDRYVLRRAEIGVGIGPAAFRSILTFGAQPARLARSLTRHGLIDCIAALQGADPMDLYLRPLRSLLTAGARRAGVR